MGSTLDVRTRTMLVCGALALAIAASVLLRGRRRRRAHQVFIGFASLVGLWYLSRALHAVLPEPVGDRLRLALAIPLPVLAVHLFEAMVPQPDPTAPAPRLGQRSVLLTVPLALVALSPYATELAAHVAIFLYAVGLSGAGLWQMWRRGQSSGSRSAQRRVQFLVAVGALAATFSFVDFVGIVAGSSAMPPIGVVTSVVFLFMLAQALRHDRLLDLYELMGRLVVAIAVAVLIAGLFYVLVTVVGQSNTMWFNAILVAIVVLVLFNPLRDWVETQIRRTVFRGGGRLAAALIRARRRLAHTLDLDQLSDVVVGALERSRRVGRAGLYVLEEGGRFYERLGSLGTEIPPRIEIATAGPLLEQLWHGPVDLGRLRRDLDEGRPALARHVSAQAVLAAAELLGPQLRDCATVFPVITEDNEQVGLLVVADDRYDEPFAPEDVALLADLAAQVGVVVVNSRVYAKMKERDRLALLGQMAAGIAHEIRNPLGAIKGAAQLLVDAPPEEDPDGQAEFLGIILEEVDRLDAVVGSVLDLARQTTSSVAPIEVNGVVRRTLQVMTPEWSEDAFDVDVALDEDLPRVAIDPDQLRQVLMNLLHNAYQAMKGQGHVAVRSRAFERDGDTWIALTVEDDGPGIPRATRNNVFLPFFTTKPEGTGLGLALSQRIVQRAGGRIELRSTEGEGTTVDVVLPAASEPLTTPPPSSVRPAEPHPPSASPTVEGLEGRGHLPSSAE